MAGPGRPWGEARGRPGEAAGGARELPSAPRPLPDRPQGGCLVTSRDTARPGGGGGCRRRQGGLLSTTNPPPPPSPVIPGEARGAPGSPPSRPKEASPALGCRWAGELRVPRPGLGQVRVPDPSSSLDKGGCRRPNRFSRPADTW